MGGVICLVPSPKITLRALPGMRRRQKGSSQEGEGGPSWLLGSRRHPSGALRGEKRPYKRPFEGGKGGKERKAGEFLGERGGPTRVFGGGALWESATRSRRGALWGRGGTFLPVLPKKTSRFEAGGTYWFVLCCFSQNSFLFRPHIASLLCRCCHFFARKNPPNGERDPFFPRGGSKRAGDTSWRRKTALFSLRAPLRVASPLPVSCPRRPPGGAFPSWGWERPSFFRLRSPKRTRSSPGR